MKCKGAGNILLLLEATTDNKNKVRQVMLDYLKQSGRCWVLSYAGRYDYLSDEALALKKHINEIKLDETMNIKSMIEAEKKLMEYSAGMISMIEANPMLPSHESGPSSGRFIVPLDIDGCLVRDGASALPLKVYCEAGRSEASNKIKVIKAQLEEWKQKGLKSLQNLRDEIREVSETSLSGAIETYNRANAGLFKAIIALSASAFLFWLLYINIDRFPSVIAGFEREGFVYIYYVLAVLFGYKAIRLLFGGFSEFIHGLRRFLLKASRAKLRKMTGRIENFIADIEIRANRISSYADALLTGVEPVKPKIVKFSTDDILKSVNRLKNKGINIKVPSNRYMTSRYKWISILILCMFAYGVHFELHNGLDGLNEIAKNTFGVDLSAKIAQLEQIAGGEAIEENISIQTPAHPATMTEEALIKYEVLVDAANVRAQPDIDGEWIATFPRGSFLICLNQASQDAEGRTWLNIQTPQGESGWISSRLVERIEKR